MTSTIDTHIGRRIRQRRWMMGMSQDQLGQAIGVRIQLLQAYEKGVTRVAPSQLWDIVRALRVDLAFFLTGTGTDAGHHDDAAVTLTAEDLLADEPVLKLLQAVFAARQVAGLEHPRKQNQLA